MCSRFKKWSRPILALVALASSQADAIQVIEGADKQHVQVTVSARETNRLAIDGRRIANVVPAQQGLIVAKKHDAAGALYFTMAPDQPPNATVTLFVSDEQNTTYKLILMPRNVAGDEIVLRPPSDRAPARSSAGARSATYQRQVKNLMLLMAEEQGGSADLGATKVAVNQEIPLWQEARLVLVARYVDSGLVGERYTLTNVSASQMQLVEQEFFRPLVRAVSIRHHALQPGTATDVYVVRERKDHE